MALHRRHLWDAYEYIPLSGTPQGCFRRKNSADHVLLTYIARIEGAMSNNVPVNGMSMELVERPSRFADGDNEVTMEIIGRPFRPFRPIMDRLMEIFYCPWSLRSVHLQNGRLWAGLARRGRARAHQAKG